MMPGDPILGFLSKFCLEPGAVYYEYGYFFKAFGFNEPLWKQYLYYWDAIFHWNLGTSMYYFPESVTSVIGQHILYTQGCSFRRSSSPTSSATVSGRWPPGAACSNRRAVT